MQATDPDDRKSIVFLANGPIFSQSNKQTTVALSMEAEYIALSEAANEAKFLRHLLSTTITSTPVIDAIVINTDSQSALEHVKNNICHACTKYIDTRHHFIRNLYRAAGEIDLLHVPLASQVADILTKSLGRTKHDEALPLTRHQTLPIDYHPRKVAFHQRSEILRLSHRTLVYSQGKETTVAC
jgi:hypothetical protein